MIMSRTSAGVRPYHHTYHKVAAEALIQMALTVVAYCALKYFLRFLISSVRKIYRDRKDSDIPHKSKSGRFCDPSAPSASASNLKGSIGDRLCPRLSFCRLLYDHASKRKPPCRDPQSLVSLSCFDTKCCEYGTELFSWMSPSPNNIVPQRE